MSFVEKKRHFSFFLIDTIHFSLDSLSEFYPNIDKTHRQHPVVHKKKRNHVNIINCVRHVDLRIIDYIQMLIEIYHFPSFTYMSKSLVLLVSSHVFAV